MSEGVTVGEKQGYVPYNDEKPNKEQFNHEHIQHEGGNDHYISQQYPVDIKQSDISNSTEDDPIIKAKLRNGFIRKVFGIVTFQLVFTFLIILTCQTTIIKRFLAKNQTLCVLLITSSIICFLVCACILTCNRKISRRVPHNYILLFFVTISESILCTSAALQYSFEVVIASIILTIAASLGIIIYTLRAKSDLSGCGMVLMVFISQLFFFGMINLFIRSSFLN